jgi:threonylcarbamoyladenosine tRNA methylthiotransferase MtaB
MNTSFFTFGCTVNNYESQELMRKFLRNGDIIVEQGETDVIIVNSCVVTGSAENGVMQLIGRQRKKHPEALIILTGCYNEYIKKSGKPPAVGHDIILLDKDVPDFIGETHRLYETHAGAAATACSSATGSASANAVAATQAAFHPVRAFVQLQNGCDNNCGYCIVPHVRGGSASIPYDEIEGRLKELLANGFREFVLAGMNLGAYARDGLSLIDVMERINGMPEVKSIRLSSLEPMDLDDSFIKRLPGISKLSPHLHIAIQSGCDHTLSRMGRKYTFPNFNSMLIEIRNRIPGIAITTDVIVGYPGESERDFEDSIKNIVRCRFSDIHIFKFSPRIGTAAAKMDGQISEHRKNDRANILRGVKAQTRYNFYTGFIGKDVKVTPLRLVDAASWEGVTAHNFPVVVRGTAPSGRITSVGITGMNAAQDAYTAVR